VVSGRGATLPPRVTRMEALACLDGAIMPAAEARISATDEGLLRGDGVFEVLRVYAGRPFALADHLERMTRSAANLRLPFDAGGLRADALALLEAGGPQDCCLRLVVTRGGRRLALLEPVPELAESVRLGCVAYQPTLVLDGVKSLSYGGNMLASRLARERGFDEALLVMPDGIVLEAPTSTIFWAAGEELWTPPLEHHILASITRSRVVEVTGAGERACTLADLRAADEAFLASTTREVQAVAGVEDHEYPAPPGPLTAQAQRRLREHIADELAAPA
jgi:branched-chain amino acid aminotransferase